uniref:AP-3 complex subunit delta n=1 Tax=Trichuris muris TaxID=70415 RepID=A0A5S6QTE4_TRIMR
MGNCAVQLRCCEANAVSPKRFPISRVHIFSWCEKRSMSANVDRVVQVTTALRKVKGNIERMFEKTPTDMIRGIRASKENESKYIGQCIDEIKVELKSEYPSVKANAVAKLTYLQMLGYDISWAAFNIIEVMSCPKFVSKRIGYLAASQAFSENTEVLMLATNQVRKDIHSSSTYDSSVAMNGLACFITVDLARDLANDIVVLLTSSKPYIRKRAILLLYRLYLKYPEAVPSTFPRLKEKLEDPDPGVQSATVNVVCELARKDPKSYLPLAPVFFKLMTSSSNNWMLIKIIKLFGCLTPLEPRLGKKLIEPLTSLINSTSAMSLLYECINTVIAVLISISSESPENHMPSIQLCVQKLSVLIEDADQNLKYLGLLAMGKILKTHPKAVQSMKDLILNCLDDKDESIRLRALDLLHGMVSRKNIMDIVKRLLYHVEHDCSAIYRDGLVAKIIQICSFSNYKYITNFEWYISVLVELTKAEGTKHGTLIAQQMLDVAVRVLPIRHFAVSQMACLIDNANMVLIGSSQYRSDLSSVLYAAAWICGEFSEHLPDPQGTIEAMLRTKTSMMPGKIQSVYVQNITKIYARLLDAYEKESDWDRIYSLNNLLLSKLPQFLSSDYLETQERAACYIELVKEIESCHRRNELVCEDLKALFAGDLNPVAPKAQRKLPVPEGLNLDEKIYSPPSSDASDVEAQEPNLFGQYEESLSKMSMGVSEEAFKKAKMDRHAERESNPHYLKSAKIPAKMTGRNYSKDDLEGFPEVNIQLGKPLGVLGLEHYERQMKHSSRKSRSKKEKKGHRRRSSSFSDSEVVVQYEIYQGDGEMPENAVTTDEENASVHKIAAVQYDTLNSAPGALLESHKKTERTKKKKQKAATKSGHHKKSATKEGKHKEDASADKLASDFDQWLAGAPAKEVEKAKERPKKEKRKKSKRKDDSNEPNKSILSELAGLNLSAPIREEYEETSGACSPRLPQSLSVTSRADQCLDSRWILQAQDEALQLHCQYNVSSEDGVDALAVKMLARNQSGTRLANIELCVVDSPVLKLLDCFSPFSLEPMESQEKVLSFGIHNVSDMQRLRAMLTYVREGDTSKLDFHLVFPFSLFTVPASVTSVRFAELTAESGGLSENCKAELSSDSDLANIVELLHEKMRLSLVESIEGKATLLFCKTIGGSPICILLKKRKKPNKLTVECRTASFTVAEAVASEAAREDTWQKSCYSTTTRNMSVPCRASLTVQVGNYANFVGSHWWNMQNSESINEQVTLEDQTHDLASFRKGKDRQGRVVLSPRVVVFEEKSNVSRLPFVSVVDGPAAAEKLPSAEGAVMVRRQSSFSENKFLTDLRSGYPTRDSVYNLDDSVKFWPDFSVNIFHPKSLFLFSESQADSFESSAETSRKSATFEDIEARIRFFTEEIDCLGGIHFLCEPTSNLAGTVPMLLEYFSEEHRKVPILGLPCWQAIFTEASFAGYRLAWVTSLTLSEMSTHCALTAPISLSSKLWNSSSECRVLQHLNYKANLPYHTAAILAVGLETICLPWKWSHAGASMGDVLETLVGSQGSQFASLELLFPTVVCPREVGGRHFGDTLHWPDDEIPQELTPFAEMGKSAIAVEQRERMLCCLKMNESVVAKRGPFSSLPVVGPLPFRSGNLFTSMMPVSTRAPFPVILRSEQAELSTTGRIRFRCASSLATMSLDTNMELIKFLKMSLSAKAAFRGACQRDVDSVFEKFAC